MWLVEDNMRNLLFSFIIRAFIIFIGIGQSYLLLRLVWRAYFEGNGYVLISFNALGEMFLELVVMLVIFIYMIVFGLYSLFGDDNY